MKAMTIRLPADLAADLETVAAVDEMTVTDAIRRAIAQHIERRRSDPTFQEQLQAHLEHAQRLLAPSTPDSQEGATA